MHVWTRLPTGKVIIPKLIDWFVDCFFSMVYMSFDERKRKTKKKSWSTEVVPNNFTDAKSFHSASEVTDCFFFCVWLGCAHGFVAPRKARLSKDLILMLGRVDKTTLSAVKSDWKFSRSFQLWYLLCRTHDGVLVFFPVFCFLVCLMLTFKKSRFNNVLSKQTD